MLASARLRISQLERHEAQTAAFHGAPRDEGGTERATAASSDCKRPRESSDVGSEEQPDLAMKVLEARAAAQSERAKRTAMQRKLRAATRELESAKRSTPKRNDTSVATPQTDGTQVLTCFPLLSCGFPTSMSKVCSPCSFVLAFDRAFPFAPPRCDIDRHDKSCRECAHKVMGRLASVKQECQLPRARDNHDAGPTSRQGLCRTHYQRLSSAQAGEGVRPSAAT